MKNTEHELHKRKSSSNIGLGLLLLGFVVMVFSVTIVKLSNGNNMQGFDHVLRPEMIASDE